MRPYGINTPYGIIGPYGLMGLGFYWLSMTLLVLLIIALLFVYPWAKILEKAGKNKWLCLLVFVPGGILILTWYLALTEWKK